MYLIIYIIILIILIIILFIIINSLILNKRLKKIKLFKLNRTYLNKNILVIGNGPNIFSKKLGNKINNFDIIFRFNYYKIKDYHEYIGYKTTFWVIPIHNFLNMSNKKRIKYINNCKTVILLIHNNFKNKLIKIQIFNFKFNKYLDKIKYLNIPKIKYKNSNYISTSGYSIINYLVTKNIPHFIYAFTFSEKHYFEKNKNKNLIKNLTNIIRKKIHNQEYEKIKIKSYIKNRKIFYL